jgi:1-deoxy-D-xylulose-5-phosphate synthase
MPKDKLIWDVGHQAYIHKILSPGARIQFPTLRQYKGLSGFPKRQESPYDALVQVIPVHLSLLPWALPSARDLKGEDYNVIAVIGDGSMTGGMSFEALNHVGDLHKKAHGGHLK